MRGEKKTAGNSGNLVPCSARTSLGPISFNNPHMTKRFQLKIYDVENNTKSNNVNYFFQHLRPCTKHKHNEWHYQHIVIIISKGEVKYYSSDDMIW